MTRTGTLFLTVIIKNPYIYLVTENCGRRCGDHASSYWSSSMLKDFKVQPAQVWKALVPVLHAPAPDTGRSWSPCGRPCGVKSRGTRALQQVSNAGSAASVCNLHKLCVLVSSYAKYVCGGWGAGGRAVASKRTVRRAELEKQHLMMFALYCWRGPAGPRFLSFPLLPPSLLFWNLGFLIIVY